MSASGGLTPVGAWSLTYSTGSAVQTATSYKGNIDGNFAVAERVSDKFAPKPPSSAGMFVVVDPGFVVYTAPNGLQTVTETGTQTLAVSAAPSSPNNRIDLVVVDMGLGTASVITGTPASSPSAPAITSGKLQVAQISVPHGTTTISNNNITDMRAVWDTEIPGIPWCIAAGTDTITGTYAPANKSLYDGLLLSFRAANGNATTTPTYNADGLGAKTITKSGGVALVARDIPGQYAECLLRYNLANTRWELLNPAVAVPTSANPSATAGPAAVNGVASTFMRSDGAPAIQKASNSQFGIVEVDGTTITSASGVISAVTTIPTTYGAVGTPAIVYVNPVVGGYPEWTSAAPAVGSTGAVSSNGSSLSGGTWRNNGVSGNPVLGYGCVPYTAYLAVRTI